MSVRIIKGDAREILPTMAAESFDCIVTSPPYYGLRDYGTATWEGGGQRLSGDGEPLYICEDCNIIRKISELTSGCPECGQTMVPYECNHEPPNEGGRCGNKGNSLTHPGRFVECDCGARRIDAQIGLEPTLDEYLETMVSVCRELRRVLKPSGVFFLVIGDSYAASHSGCQHTGLASAAERYDGNSRNKSGPRAALVKRSAPCSFKPKDLCLVPERLGILLQADGWWIRSKIIWHKLNPMPESCTDRPTSAHETVWMLTKAATYFWDGQAVKEDATFSRPNNMEKASPKTLAMQDNGTHGKGGNLGGINSNYQSHNLRNVWSFSSHPFQGAHFATFPPELAERCIKAGSSERGCCPACGKPWVRVVETERVKHEHTSGKGARHTVPGSETSAHVSALALFLSIERQAGNHPVNVQPPLPAPLFAEVAAE